MPRSDLQPLRHTLARRLRQNAELERRVREVKAQFEGEVAPLQEEVLRLRKEQLKEAAQARMRSARLRNAYHDAQDAHATFQDRRSQRPDEPDPSTVKALYRRATKLCHPDAVDDSYREDATATFRALESAFDAGHPHAVQAIADALETWGFPRAPGAPPEGSVENTETALRRAVSDLDASIESLRQSDAYEAAQAAEDAADIEPLIDAQKRALLQRLRALKRRGTPAV
jgi:hypothetical protein